ncbi:MAG: hypothetical protein GY771_07755 [bacterium]|nr:hypothetical protein [bacterium]
MPRKLSESLNTLSNMRWLFYFAAAFILVGIAALFVLFYRPWNIIALCFIPLAFAVAAGDRILGVLLGLGYFAGELAEDEQITEKREEVDEYLLETYPEEYGEEEEIADSV